MPLTAVKIEGMRSQCEQGSNRVLACVDGFEVWFESLDLPMQANPEAYASAFVIPCLLRQVQLTIDEPLCSKWYTNVCELLKILSESWGQHLNLPQTAQITDAGTASSEARAQFFSGGVDSFYALFKAKNRVDYLVTVQGFDMGLDDSIRFEHLKDSLNEVAHHFGAEPCTVRTNLRQHPLISSVSWDDAHGGALAAVGHLLSEQIGSVVIPPSWSDKNFQSLWGTHWSLDHLWSSSSFSVIHGDASLSRVERIKAIAHEPLVQRHLRVCYDNSTPYGNCSRCPKCVRTMAVLHHCGKLQNFPVFDSSVPIWQLIDELPSVSLTSSYDELLESDIEPKLRSAILRLLKRRSRALVEAEIAVAQNQYLLAHNQQLAVANKELESELRRLQSEIQAMANSRVWQAGNMLRRCRELLLPRS